MFLANLFDANQTDTQKIFLVESEDFFWHESKNFFLLFFFLAEQAQKESEGLKIEWFEPFAVLPWTCSGSKKLFFQHSQ